MRKNSHSAFAVLLFMMMLLSPSAASAVSVHSDDVATNADATLIAQVYDDDDESSSVTTTFGSDDEGEVETGSNAVDGTAGDEEGQSKSMPSTKTIVYVVCGIIGFMVVVIGLILLISLFTRGSNSGKSKTPLFLGCGCCSLLAIMLLAACIFTMFFWGGNSKSGGGQDDEPSIYVDEETEGTDSVETVVVGSDEDNRDPNDPDYTPARYAIKAGEDGGKWSMLQSGETVYEYPASGEYARSVWVNDGGKLYYVDASGCRMCSNYAHDGFFADANGQWDESKKPITENILPSERVYSDGSTRWTFSMNEDSDGTISGTARQTYSNGNSEVYTVTSFGHSAYRLVFTKDSHMQAHLVVLNGGRRIVISCGGTTDAYDLQ